MTTIVAIRDDSQTFMLADKLGSADGIIVEKNTDKILRLETDIGTVLVGFAGNSKHYYSLKYDLPARDFKYAGSDTEYFIRKIFVPAIRKIFEENKYFNKDGEIDGSLLIATRDDIFRISSELGITKVEKNFWAMGSGSDFALGALDALMEVDGTTKLSVLNMAEVAMSVSHEFNLYTGDTYLIERIPRK